MYGSTDAKNIIASSRAAAQRAVSIALVQRNWLLDKRIVVEELKGERVEYGHRIDQQPRKETSRAGAKEICS